MDTAQFKALVGGRRRGVAAALLRAALWLGSLGYAAVMRLRNLAYDRRWLREYRVEAPVVCVGNLTLGGTGITPMVEWLARWLRSQDVRVAIVSRGYGAESGGYNDEALELDQRLPDVPHVQDRHRVAACRLAIEELGTQIVLLDDGLQHRRLARDLNLVLVDALEPFGLEYVFPRGTLREPLSGLRRADAIVLTRADMVHESQRQRIRQRMRALNPQAAWVETAHRPRHLLAADGSTRPLSQLAGKPVAAFCGIGNPAGFRHTLEGCHFTVAAWQEFPDHHPYRRADIEMLTSWADDAAVEAVVCTHKDLVKVGVPCLGHRPLWAVAIGLEVLSGEADLTTLLGPLVERARAIELPEV
jgi:tetraacyldisaccharide 4'-kinase